MPTRRGLVLAMGGGVVALCGCTALDDDEDTGDDEVTVVHPPDHEA